MSLFAFAFAFAFAFSCSCCFWSCSFAGSFCLPASAGKLESLHKVPVCCAPELRSCPTRLASAPSFVKMSKRSGPNLQLYMDKRLAIRLNASRNVVGVLRGFDQFMNIVLDEAVELLVGKEKHDIGMVVRTVSPEIVCP